MLISIIMLILIILLILLLLIQIMIIMIIIMITLQMMLIILIILTILIMLIIPEPSAGLRIMIILVTGHVLQTQCCYRSYSRSCTYHIIDHLQTSMIILFTDHISYRLSAVCDSCAPLCVDDVRIMCSDYVRSCCSDYVWDYVRDFCVCMCEGQYIRLVQLYKDANTLV